MAERGVTPFPGKQSPWAAAQPALSGADATRQGRSASPGPAAAEQPPLWGPLGTGEPGTRAAPRVCCGDLRLQVAAPEFPVLAAVTGTLLRCWQPAARPRAAVARMATRLMLQMGRKLSLKKFTLML